jgi:hypothetical protein
MTRPLLLLFVVTTSGLAMALSGCERGSAATIDAGTSASAAIASTSATTAPPDPTPVATNPAAPGGKALPHGTPVHLADGGVGYASGDGGLWTPPPGWAPPPGLIPSTFPPMPSGFPAGFPTALPSSIPTTLPKGFPTALPIPSH